MNVVQTDTGRWAVRDASGSTLATFPTNREAWAYVDRRTGESDFDHAGRMEWAWQQRARGEP